MKGPSRWAPRTIAPSVPFSLASFITFIDFLISSTDTVIVVGVKAVVPCLTIVLEISLIASKVPSIVSCPPAPWIWTSINPGDKYSPSASITSESLILFGFISLIFPSSIKIEPFSILSKYTMLQFLIIIWAPPYL